MPHGLGKSAIVAVYTTPDMADKAREAGADLIVDSTVLNDVINSVLWIVDLLLYIDKEWKCPVREVLGYTWSRWQLEAFRKNFGS